MREYEHSIFFKQTNLQIIKHYLIIISSLSSFSLPCPPPNTLTSSTFVPRIRFFSPQPNYRYILLLLLSLLFNIFEYSHKHTHTNKFDGEGWRVRMRVVTVGETNKTPIPDRTTPVHHQCGKWQPSRVYQEPY